MAEINITQYVSGDFYNEIFLPGIVFSTIDTGSPTEITLVNDTDAGITTVVTGSGFTFDANGLSGGTVESVAFFDNGTLSAEMTGLDLSGGGVGDAIQDARGGDLSAIEEILDADPVDYSAAAVPTGGVRYDATPNGDMILGSDGQDSFSGGAGDDTIDPGDNSDGGDFISGSVGDDTIVYSHSTSSSAFQSLSYRFYGGNEGLLVTIDGTTNTATLDKGVDGFDTITDIATPLSRSSGGFGLEGTDLADVFNLATADGQFMQVAGAAGDDTFNVVSGRFRIDYRNTDNGINVDLSAGTASDDGFGDIDTFTGDVWEIRGSDYSDIIVGSDNDESFIGREGDDVIDGGGGMDRLRFNRPGVSDLFVDLKNGTATGTWNGNAFNYTISNIENIFGGEGDDEFIGDDGTNEFNGGGGNDSINPGDNSDYDFISGSTGNDTIDYSRSVNGFQSIGYNFFGAAEGLSVTIDGISNTATVDKGAAGVDTFTDIATALEGGGFGIEGTDLADSFVISNELDQWMRIIGGGGNDTFEVLSGEVALDYRRAQIGIDVDLINGVVAEDGFGDADTIIGDVDGVRGSDFDDTMVAGSKGVSFQGRGGNDILIGGDGTDELDGGDGDDTLDPGDNTDFDFISGSRGTDSIDYALGITGYQGIGYQFYGATSGLLVTIDGTTNTATVDKGADGFDTITDIANPLDNGGFGIAGTHLEDVFNITNLDGQWMQVAGGAGNDTFNVTSGLVRLDYKDAANGIQVDLEAGTASDDGFGDTDTITGVIGQLRGSAFEDTVSLGAGSHQIEGGESHDTIVYDGLRSDFGQDLQADGSIHVLKTGGDMDTLIDVERIDFTDGDLIYDIESPNLGFTYRLYSAAFDRTPDEGGLRFWTGIMDHLEASNPSANNREIVADIFIGSGEFVSLYGTDPSNADYVDAMYWNALDRLPDAPGREYWINAMENGLTRTDVLLSFSESAEHQRIVAPDLDDGVWVF